MKRAHRHIQAWLVLSQAVSMRTIRRAKCMRKSRVRCSCLHLPSVYSGSTSTVNEINCNKKNSHQLKNSYELISNSIQTCPTTMCLKRDAIDCIVLEKWVLHLVEGLRSHARASHSNLHTMPASASETAKLRSAWQGAQEDK